MHVAFQFQNPLRYEKIHLCKALGKLENIVSCRFFVTFPTVGKLGTFFEKHQLARVLKYCLCSGPPKELAGPGAKFYSGPL